MSSELYFLGAVGLVNSLRLQGHDEPIYLLDLGLSAEQRELLAGEVTVVESPRGVEPWLAKTIAPLRHPHQTMVLIDVDMIVTRDLGELIERAGRGEVLGFENDVERHLPEWGSCSSSARSAASRICARASSPVAAPSASSCSS